MTDITIKAARALDDSALATLFTEAHSANGFLKAPVPHETLEKLFTLAMMGPTSANTQPVRMVFVESAAAKERLVATLSPGNVGKTRSAPVTVIFAADTRFFEYIPRLNPFMTGMVAGFEGDENAPAALSFAKMNATLGGAYFTLAARALGLDVGPMGGFDKEKLDADFFPDGRYASIWLANIGYADDTKVRPRNPRLTFAEAAQIV